ncbi:hypothetical protein EAX62_05670 [Tessaracoccus antarcticus]|uniref:Uncharacterized protein n=1 Tax=Tessaracoccus antarcticus TaxID=2479848 RepID=A0A3M0GAS5_9ACTN|nr:hypothetical protein EAX62_05670 [Tessaracoccus antarcticus]
MALLGLGAVSGCSLPPVNFSPESATPSPSASVDPTVIMDPEFLARATDGTPKLLPEGVASGQRFSTPHLDGVLAEFVVGESLSQTTVLQVGVDTPVRAPQGYELAAFTLRGGVPTFISGAGHEPVVVLRVGDRRIPVANLFNEFSTQAGVYLTLWEMFVLCVPTGSDVALEVTDEDTTVAVDLRTGLPQDNDGWRATTGFRERWDITCDPEKGVFTRDFTTVPPAGTEPESGRFNIGFRPDVGGGLRPWTPSQGWAPTGTQWLAVGMGARVQWEGGVVPLFTLSVPKSFLHTDASGVQVAATHPQSVTTDALVTGQAELLVVWPVIARAGTSSFSFNAVGDMSVDYAETVGVPAQFSTPATALEFVLTTSPSQR